MKAFEVRSKNPIVFDLKYGVWAKERKTPKGYYYTAFFSDTRPKPATGYGEWKEFDEDECIKQILNGSVPVTYSDNIYALNTLQVKKAWNLLDKIIERRDKLKKLILRELGQKECFQYVVENNIDEEGDSFRYYDEKAKKYKSCRIVKIIKQWRKPLTLILKRKDNGKHIKLKVTKDLISLWKRFYKEIKVGFEVDYVPKDGIGFIECVCVKILEGEEKKKKKRKSVLDYVPKIVPFDIPDYMKKGFGAKKKFFPKGAVFSEYKVPFIIPEYMQTIIEEIGKPGKIIGYPKGAGRVFMYDEYLRDHLARVARCEERSKLIHAIDEREKLKEFHKRPYFNVVVEEVKGKPLGKENLEKIKFPCYCSYECNGSEWVGTLDRDFEYYYLNSMNTQKDFNTVDKRAILRDLMDRYKIEILKGELRLWKVAK